MPRPIITGPYVLGKRVIPMSYQIGESRVCKCASSGLAIARALHMKIRMCSGDDWGFSSDSSWAEGQASM